MCWALQITMVEPAVGAAAGGTFVTIHGRNFGSTPENIARLILGGVDHTHMLTLLTSTMMTCVTLPAALADLRSRSTLIETVDGGDGIVDRGFSYAIAPIKDKDQPQVLSTFYFYFVLPSVLVEGHYTRSFWRVSIERPSRRWDVSAHPRQQSWKRQVC
jgi:hypothetical protein